MVDQLHRLQGPNTFDVGVQFVEDRPHRDTGGSLEKWSYVERWMTKRRIKRTLKLIFGKLRPLRADDIFLASYPRSGNTWMRNIIAHLLYPNESIDTLDVLDSLVPDIHRGLPVRQPYNEPRVVKTHAPFAFSRHAGDRSYNRTIYLARHPFNVARSYYDYLRTINPRRSGGSMESFVRKFTDGAIWPGSWQEHVTSWRAMESEVDILFVRYEDMRKNTTEAIVDVADFLGHPLAVEDASRVARKCSRERMVKAERRGPLVDETYHFVRRREKARDTTESLTFEMKALIAERNQVAMRLLGYDMDHQ